MRPVTGSLAKSKPKSIARKFGAETYGIVNDFMRGFPASALCKPKFIGIIAITIFSSGYIDQRKAKPPYPEHHLFRPS